VKNNAGDGDRAPSPPTLKITYQEFRETGCYAVASWLALGFIGVISPDTSCLTNLSANENFNR
jgi:hypothetical protein